MASFENLLSAEGLHFSKSYSKSTRRTTLRVAKTFKLRPTAPLRRSCTVLCALSYGNSSGAGGEDFVTKVLRENPSQVESKYLIGDKLYSLKEKQDLTRATNGGLFDQLRNKLVAKLETGSSEHGKESGDVYLNDILRAYKGKLYVPEQVFGKDLSEEEEFDKNVDELPKMSLEDFRKALRSDKVKLLTLKEESDGFHSGGLMYFVVDLEEIPGDKRLQRTKWAMRLDETEAQSILEEYTGPRYEIERHMTLQSWVGKVPEYPTPAASSISSRVMVELGIVTALMAAAAVVVGGFLASAVFAVTSFVFAATVYVAWPVCKPFIKIFLGMISGILERVWYILVDFFGDGGVISNLYRYYSFGGISASMEMLTPIIAVLVTMVLLIRFTISRRPKNFRKWDLWQGIDFSQSKAEARVDGSTGVKFSDIAGIDEAVDELQEIGIQTNNLQQLNH